MQRFSCRLGAAFAVLSSLSGCASLPRAEGISEVHALVDQRNGVGLNWSTSDERDATLATLLAQPLTADRAVEIALLRNPRLQMEFARLGIAQADVFAASRIGNPTFSVSALSPNRSAEKTRIDAGLSASFAELLLLPSRQRLALGEYARSKELIGSALLNLLCDVRSAWFNYLGAQQVSRMRDTVASVAATSAELAAKFYVAGNIAALELKLQQAAATQTRLEATRARTEATRARSALNQLLGLSGIQAHWQTSEGLPMPRADEDSIETLLALAQQQRLDLRATQQEVALVEQGLGITRRYRWLGSIDLGVAAERDNDGTRLSGPTLSLQLPIFNQGQAAIARAEAQLAQGRARLQALQIEIETSVRLGLERIAAARTIAEDYRTALIPQREAIVAHTQEKNDFALVGVFELLLTRQQEVDAYQGYVEAVRDYWLARVELTRAVGARLPSDADSSDKTIDTGAVLGIAPEHETPADHDQHNMQHDIMNSQPTPHDSSTPSTTKSPPAPTHAGATP